jgi:hypothetical protein
LKRRAELHIDTKNKTKGADIIQILAAYVWWLLGHLIHK